MKQTFEIPEGCTRVTIEQHEDKVLTIFESKRFEEKDLLRYETILTNNSHGVCVEFKEEEPEVRFKEGDIIYCKDKICELILIFKENCGTILNPYLCHCAYKFKKQLFFENLRVRNSFDIIRFATESEKQLLFDALAEDGKKWNAEKKCIEDLKPERWRANVGCKYWFVSSSLNCLSTNDLFSLLDNIRYEVGNYFQTEQQAKDFAKQIKQLPR